MGRYLSLAWAVNLTAYLTALLRLVAHWEQAGDLNEAMGWATRAVSVAPLREEGHVHLISLYLAANRPGDALARYAEWERLLRDNFNEAPSPELQARIAPFTKGGLSPSQTPVAGIAASLSPPPIPIATDRQDFRLPAPLNRFFGRETELERLAGMLTRRGAVRLITLTGPGGSGKTRLALEAAARADAFAGAIAFVPLADLFEPDQVPEAIAQALRLPPSANKHPLERVLAALQGRPALMILDNLEHLIDTSPPTGISTGTGRESGTALLSELLTCLPQLTLLVTSRQRTRLEGEQDIPVAPLSVPGSKAGHAPERLLDFAAVRLFADRAQMARPDFQVTARNAEAVAALCVRLEGMPLALELAAAWASLMTPAQMLERLSLADTGDALLSSRKRRYTDRHRTLQATLAWSVERLPDPLLRFWKRLSIFRGGWTVDAAQAICGDPEMEGNVLESLAALQERSLLYTEEATTGMRFRMLEALRQQGAEMLNLEETALLRWQYIAYFTTFAEAQARDLQGLEQKRRLEALEDEYPNLRTALEESLTEESGLRLAAALWEFWLIRGRLAEGHRYLTEVLTQSAIETAPILHAAILNGLGSIAQARSDFRAAAAAYARSLEIYERLQDRVQIAALLSNQGLIAELEGRFDEAKALHERSLALRREVGDRRGVASSLNNLGVLAQELHEYELARHYYKESLTIKRELGEKRPIAHSYNNLGNIAHALGEYREADYCHQQALSLRRELGDRQGVAASLNNLAMIALTERDLAKARALLIESVAVKREVGDAIGEARSLYNLAFVALGEGDYTAARHSLEECLNIQRRTSVRRQDAASVLDIFLRLAVAQVEYPRAAWLCGACDGLLEATGIGRKPAEEATFLVARAATEQVVGDASFNALYGEGRRAPLERIIRIALREEVPPWWEK